jgi:peptidyl-prolyl cis-trans isomerase SurA
MLRYTWACLWEIAPVPIIPTLMGVSIVAAGGMRATGPHATGASESGRYNENSRMKRHFATYAAIAGALALASCKHTPPPNVAAEVNGQVITYADLDKLYQTQYPQTVGSNEDQVMSNKLEVLNSMITTEIMRQRAEKLGLTALDADVDAEFNKRTAGLTKEEIEKRLAERHMTIADAKAQIRRDLTVDKLINKEITSHIMITDSDVTNFYNANKGSFNLAEPQVHLAQILVTPFPNPNVRNLKNSKAQTDAEAQTKIKDIADRLKRGEDFGMIAQNYSEDPDSAPNGGDMGFIPQSNLEKASPELRRLVDSLEPGQFSAPIHTPDGYRILKVITREPAGQRDLNDPRVQQNIRETLLNRKDQLLKSAYYEVQRNNAKIRNYLAQSIVQGASK